MTKVKCEDCAHWMFSHEQLMRKGGYMFSFSFAYKKVKKGYCMCGKCGENTSGYTGITSGHKMTREGGKLRYCRFFKPKNVVGCLKKAEKNEREKKP